MYLTPKLRYFAECKVFENLSKDEMKQLVEHLVIADFKKGEKIVLNTGNSSHVYF